MSIYLSQGYCVEKWFRSAMQQGRVLSSNPSLELVKRVLSSTLSNKYNTVLKYYLDNPLDAAEYLDLVLKCDCIIELENESGEILKVAIDVTLKSDATEKLKEINQIKYYQARKELGINRHWVVQLPGDYFETLDKLELIDEFYTAIDEKQATAVINLQKVKV